GPDRGALKELSVQLGLQDCVEFPGWVRPVWDELAAATMFVLPSRYEGFPSALLEAMVVGVPSIAVDCESGPRAILAERHSKASFTTESERRQERGPSTALTQGQLPGGLLVPNDIASMSDAMRLFMADPQTRERTGRQGIGVAEGFGWQELVDRYEAVLMQVVENLN
ncbi:MAG TPA: hypothetical protein DEF45_16730, partial [Rhodopirellula sp.]|nr:hypothetical protein [Rhodopirellula sp.]